MSAWEPFAHPASRTSENPGRIPLAAIPRDVYPCTIHTPRFGLTFPFIDLWGCFTRVSRQLFLCVFHSPLNKLRRLFIHSMR